MHLRKIKAAINAKYFMKVAELWNVTEIIKFENSLVGLGSVRQDTVCLVKYIFVLSFIWSLM